jgi:hypothetical protein
LAKLSNAQISSQELHFLTAADVIFRRHAGQLGEVLDDPSTPEPTPPFDALQIDEADIKAAWSCLLD